MSVTLEPEEIMAVIASLANKLDSTIRYPQGQTGGPGNVPTTKEQIVIGIIRRMNELANTIELHFGKNTAQTP